MTVAVLLLAVLKDSWCFGAVGGVRVKKRMRRKKGALPIFLFVFYGGKQFSPQQCCHFVFGKY